MLNFKEFYLALVICLLFSLIRSINSVKYNQISTFDVNGQFWNGEAIADFTCGTENNEDDIFNEDPRYLGSYLKVRIGTVRFENCRFPEIRRKYGVEFVNLHTFNMSSIDLELLNNGTFKGANKVKTVIASNNRLKEIPAHVFDETISLQTIDFSNNSIGNIDALSFEGAFALTKLNLSANSINQTTLESISVPSLTILDLSLNPIGSLSVKSFAKVPSLEHLNLRQANITSIGQKTFLRQHKLISLDLSANKLVKLNINLFHPSAQSSLRSLSLNGNQLTELHCVLNSTLTDFNYLDLKNNNFNCSYLKAFMDFVHLKNSWYNFTRYPASSISESIFITINGIKCTATSSNSTSSTYNQFQVEICPGIDNGNETGLILPIILMSMCICILATASAVVYRRFGNRFLIISNNLNWMSSESTVQIAAE